MQTTLICCAYVLVSVSIDSHFDGLLLRFLPNTLPFHCLRGLLQLQAPFITSQQHRPSTFEALPALRFHHMSIFISH